MEEVSATLSLLYSTRDKMLKLEAEGCALVEAVVEYVLTCFWSYDPQISLEPVAQGPIAEMEEAT
jgi:hypothetical protein